MIHRSNPDMEQPESEARLPRRVQGAMAVAVLLVGVVGVISWYMLGESAQDADWVAHTYSVSRALEITLRHLDDVETGARGFALTGDERFLQPYQSGKYALWVDLEGLRLLVRDNPEQEQRLDVLVEQTKSRLEQAEVVVTLRKSSGQLPAAAAFERGRQLMEGVRTTIATMEAEETRLLEQRTRRVRRTQHFANTTVGFGSILGILFLCFAGITVSREMRVTARAQAQVKALNAELEHRVEQRTAALGAEVAAHQGTEAKLRSSEEMFRMLLDGITDYAVYMLDAEGRVVSWNSGAARIHGYSAEEIIGKHVSCLYNATDRERNCPQDSLRKSAGTGRFEGEGWRVRKDGSEFWAHAVITPVYQPDGSLSGYSKVVRDITARKQADEELKKQAALLDLAHDAILVRDLESRVVFWNRGAQHMYGWSAGEAEGRVTHSLLQTRFPVPLSTIEAVIASKGEWEGELRHRTRHGTEVIVASRWSLQRDERGTPTAILEINRDITDRKLAEAALSESEGRLAGVIASAMDAIITVDDQHLIVLFNRAAEKMFRCPGTEAIGQSITRFIPQRFHASHAEHINRFAATGVTNRAMGTQDVLWGLRADGQEFQIEASISQVVTGGKKLFTVILRDITERVQAQQALLDAQARMSGIVASAMDAIITIDSEQRILVFNAAAATIFRCSAAEAVGQTIERFLPQRFRSAHAAHVAHSGRRAPRIAPWVSWVRCGQFGRTARNFRSRPPSRR
jgi:PAS domain S-box-containing protein